MVDLEEGVPRTKKVIRHLEEMDTTLNSPLFQAYEKTYVYLLDKLNPFNIWRGRPEQEIIHEVFGLTELIELILLSGVEVEDLVALSGVSRWFRQFRGALPSL